MPLSPDFRHAGLVKKADPIDEFRGKEWVVKHGDPSRPGYRLLHPGREKGMSHRAASRGISQKYPNALNINLVPRPKSGLGKPGGKHKKFMVDPDKRLNRREEEAMNPRAIERVLEARGQIQAREDAQKPQKFLPGIGLHAPNETPPELNIEQDMERYIRDNIVPELQTPLRMQIKANLAGQLGPKLAGLAEGDRRLVRQKADIFVAHHARPSGQAANNLQQAAGAFDPGIASHVAEAKRRYPNDRNKKMAFVFYAKAREEFNKGDKRNAQKFLEAANNAMAAMPKGGRERVEVNVAANNWVDQRAGGQKRGLALNETINSQGIIVDRDIDRKAKRDLIRAKAMADLAQANDEAAARGRGDAQAQREKTARTINPPAGSIIVPAMSRKTGFAPRLVAVHIDKDFDDPRAMEEFLKMKDPDGNPMFKGDGNDVLFVESDPDNPALDTLKGLARLYKVQVVEDNVAGANARGLKRQREKRLKAINDLANQAGGIPEVVAFRRLGRKKRVRMPTDSEGVNIRALETAAAGHENDLINLHLNRGPDTFGDERAALVIQPGFRGKSDDPRGFGIILSDVRAVGGPKPVPPAPPAPGIEVALQEEHFKDPQNGIGNAPEGGLGKFIRKNLSRFQITRNGKKGISPNDWVKDTDKHPPETWMLKGASGMIKNDILNEQIAFSLMRAADVDIPDTKWADHPGGPGQSVLQRHYTEQFGGDIVPNDGYWGRHTLDKIKAGSNPNSIAELVVLDYLINNRADRHVGNYLTIQEPGGALRIGIIDQGFAFGSSEQGGGLQRSFPDFFRIYNGKGAQGAALGKLAGSAPEIDRQLKEVLVKFERVDVDAIKNSFQRRGLTPEQLAWTEKWLGEFEYRRTWLRDNHSRATQTLAEAARIMP